VTRSEALARAAAARVGRIATVRPDGSPHVVPFVFALVVDGDRVRLYWAVDDKPKRSTAIARIDNIRANPHVEAVVDEYDEDWRRLWWVRLRGIGRLVESDPERTEALAALSEKYPAYRRRLPAGAVLAIDVSDVWSWAASRAG
jgi:PPOX class probable F420-dependent enzyme